MGIKLKFVMLIVCLIMASPVWAGRVALVIGNNTYPEQPLKNPVNDADAISRVLTDIGFKVIQANNVSRDAFEDALADFGELAPGAEVALVYYAGHAIQVDGENYMIPVNTPVKHRRDLRKLINLKDMMAEAEAASGLGLVLVDACRTNPFSERLTRQLGRSVGGRGLARVEDTPGNVLVGFAAKDGEIALDGMRGNSPYAKALVQYLPRENLDVRRLLGGVRDTVRKMTRDQQQPYTYGSLGEEPWFLAGTQSGGVAESVAVQLQSEKFAATVDQRRRPTNQQQGKTIVVGDGGRGYSIQIFAASGERGRKMALLVYQSVRADGYPVYVLRVNVNGKIVDRVRVGPYSSKESARIVQTRMKARFSKNKFILNSFITKEDVERVR